MTSKRLKSRTVISNVISQKGKKMKLLSYQGEGATEDSIHQGRVGWFTLGLKSNQRHSQLLFIGNLPASALIAQPKADTFWRRQYIRSTTHDFMCSM